MTISRHTWAFERGTLWAVDLAGEGQAPALVSARAAAVFGEAHRETAAPLAAAMGLPDPDPVLRRFANGRRCFAAWIEDRIAAYGWVSQATECIGELERKIQLLAGEAYIWDCATLPPYRRQRLYSALLGHVLTQLRGEGVRRVWIGTSLHNQPSLRGFANAGFQPVVTLAYARLFNLRCIWMIGHRGAPGHLVAAARRALTADHERVWGSAVIGRFKPAQFPGCVRYE